MINRYITAAILVTTLSCSHLANAVLIRVSDGDTVTNLASETGTIWDIDNDSGNLLGAFNVAVGTALWDVVFRDGSFTDVYTSTATVEATTQQEAENFSDALASAVLIDGGSVQYMFAANPELINGCSLGYCEVYTPFGPRRDDMPGREASYTRTIKDLRTFVAGVRWRYEDFDDDDDYMTYAKWTIASVTEVPTPSPFSILALGLIGLAARRFNKQS